MNFGFDRQNIKIEFIGRESDFFGKRANQQ